MTRRDVDAVVAGGGTAAFACAVAAVQAGARRVVMLEKAPRPEFGGNARFSTTGFRLAYDEPANLRPFLPRLTDDDFQALAISRYTVDDFVGTLNHVTGGQMDQAMARVLATESYEAARWMLDLGIAWEPWHNFIMVDGKKVYPPGAVIHPVGGGAGQLERWRDIATEMGIELWYEARVTALLGDDSRIEGVRAQRADGETELYAPSVFLCTGGFQANAAMRTDHLPTNAELFKVRGSRHDTGEVLQMAVDLGARRGGPWDGAHASPIDAKAPDFESGSKVNRYDYTLGIVVNKLGQRFFDEGETYHTETYAKTGWAVNAQPDGVAYEIFDSVGKALLRPMYQHSEPYVADTIEELAQRMGVDAAGFADTVKRFNAAVDTSRPFAPPVEDGRGTTGLVPPKSHWANPIERPPFYGYPIGGGITFTFGGLDVDENAQVRNAAGQPIQGLYAVGDIMGLFYANYPGGSGQTRNAVFGRRAGQHAVRQGK